MESVRKEGASSFVETADVVSNTKSRTRTSKDSSEKAISAKSNGNKATGSAKDDGALAPNVGQDSTANVTSSEAMSCPRVDAFPHFLAAMPHGNVIATSPDALAGMMQHYSKALQVPSLPFPFVLSNPAMAPPYNPQQQRQPQQGSSSSVKGKRLYTTERAGKESAEMQRNNRHLLVPTKSSKAVANNSNGHFTSVYRGVTKHRLTGRYEAHFWDSSYVRPQTGKKGRAKGRQIYLGGFADETEAAHAYDKIALVYLGPNAPTNFPASQYTEFLSQVNSPEEALHEIRRTSTGFARGKSRFRGVSNCGNGKWEARIKIQQKLSSNCVDQSLHQNGGHTYYLGMYATPEEAARAYDKAIVKLKGSKAVTNFPLRDYDKIVKEQEMYDVHGVRKTSASEPDYRRVPGLEAQPSSPSALTTGALAQANEFSHVFPLLINPQAVTAGGSIAAGDGGQIKTAQTHPMQHVSNPNELLQQMCQMYSSFQFPQSSSSKEQQGWNAHGIPSNSALYMQENVCIPEMKPTSSLATTHAAAGTEGPKNVEVGSTRLDRADKSDMSADKMANKPDESDFLQQVKMDDSINYKEGMKANKNEAEQQGSKRRTVADRISVRKRTRSGKRLPSKDHAEEDEELGDEDCIKLHRPPPIQEEGKYAALAASLLNPLREPL